MTDPFILLLLTVMFVLLLVIIILARVVIFSAGEFLKKQTQSESKTGTVYTLTAVIFLMTLSAGFSASAQSNLATNTEIAKTSVSSTTYWVLVSVVAVELLVIFFLVYFLKTFLKKPDESVVEVEVAVEIPRSERVSIWNRLNRFKPIAQEAQIDLGHNYDGIRELDNRLPPWWLYGFYCTILFAVVYLWRFHVSHTGLSSQQEFQLAMRQADEQKEAYLKNAASNVDENTIHFQHDDATISAGKAVFVQNCSPCHGKEGEGIVGPNLTDDYWLHGGSIKDIFKSIKYGWPDKGMKSWKDDLSASQIAQLSNFIKSIHGSHPNNAKEQQGEIYIEKEAGKDSVSIKPGATPASN